MELKNAYEIELWSKIVASIVYETEDGKNRLLSHADSMVHKLRLRMTKYDERSTFMEVALDNKPTLNEKWRKMFNRVIGEMVKNHHRITEATFIDQLKEQIEYHRLVSQGSGNETIFIGMAEDWYNNIQTKVDKTVERSQTLTEKPTLEGKNAECDNVARDIGYYERLYQMAYDHVAKARGCNINDFLNRLSCNNEYKDFFLAQKEDFMERAKEWYNEKEVIKLMTDDDWENIFEAIYDDMTEENLSGEQAFASKLSGKEEYIALEFAGRMGIDKKARQWWGRYAQSIG